MLLLQYTTASFQPGNALSNSSFLPRREAFMRRFSVHVDQGSIHSHECWKYLDAR